jgi:hypothetical protein
MSKSDDESVVGCLLMGVILVGLVIGFGCRWADVTGPEYSRGSRTGVLYKLSNPGLLWKSWEGELALPGMSTRGSGDSRSVSSVFDFSVTDPTVLSQLQAISERGEVHVRLEYVQGWFKGRCSTPYRVTKVSEVSQ